MRVKEHVFLSATIGEQGESDKWTAADRGGATLAYLALQITNWFCRWCSDSWSGGQ